MKRSHTPLSYLLAALSAVLFAATLLTDDALAQANARVYAVGLNHPDGMALDHRGRLWVAQHGSGSDAGGACTTSAGVSLVTRSHSVFPVVESLPSCTIEGEPMGTHDVLFDERGRLLILQGAGFESLSASLLGYDVDHRGQSPHGPPPFRRPSEIESLAQIFPFVMDELGTHESNPFRIARGPDGDQFIVDAAANAIVRRDRDTGALSIFATFENVPNPLSPLGPPTIHAVPTGIAFAGDRFFVGSLTGFPFPQGGASIYEVDLDGNVAPLKGGLTTVSDLVIDPRDGMIVFTRMGRFELPTGFAPNSGGIFKLNPSDGSITPILEDLDFPVGLAIGRPGELFVSLFRRGEILQVHSPSLDGGDNAEGRRPSSLAARRVSFTLRQNTPNPFNPSTTIAFALPEATDVRLAVYDLVGREVARPVDGPLGAGEHEVQFDAVGLPSGIYLYRLDAGTYSATRRMIVMK